MTGKKFTYKELASPWEDAGISRVKEQRFRCGHRGDCGTKDGRLCAECRLAEVRAKRKA